jgi:hypothetical protein
MTTRRQRGNDTVNLTATYLKHNGWPFAEPVGTGRPGTDILGTPGLVWEIKARAQLTIAADMRQALTHAHNGQLPILLLRPNGMGPAAIHQWPTILPLNATIRLLHQAGYGTAGDTTK